jgi:hypothetical protein
VRPISSTTERFERDPKEFVHLAELRGRRADAQRREQRARLAPLRTAVSLGLRRAAAIRRAFGGA